MMSHQWKIRQYFEENRYLGISPLNYAYGTLKEM